MAQESNELGLKKVKSVRLQDTDAAEEHDTDMKPRKSNYKRANTNVGIMNKFILQFSRVERAYREVEDAFILISKEAAARKLQERMKRPCRMCHVVPILEYLGFGADCFTTQELTDIFDKSPDSEDTISFQRLLIGVGVSYFAKLDKEKRAEEAKENSGTEVENAAKDEVVAPDGDADADDAEEAKQSEAALRFENVGAGFAVVKRMFDTIDEDGSGEISVAEFQSSFNDICRDPEIVKQRMDELDYNHDQEISFKEFIFGISSWCGFNDEMQNDDADDDLDAASPRSENADDGDQ